MSATHEDFKREVRRSGPSDRSIGLVIAAALVVIGILPMRHGRPVRLWSIILSGVVLLLALARPVSLRGANRIWMKIGLLLGKVVNPLVTGLLFYLVFTPAAFILRRMGKDLLELRLNQTSETYWTSRTSSAASGMADQF